MTNCKHAVATDKTCGCQNSETLIECLNKSRRLSDRSDGARNHAKEENGRVFLRKKYCSKQHCVDFEEGEEMSDCKHATHLDRKWLELSTISCHVVECRSPEAFNDKSLKFKDEKGREWDVSAYRRPCDKDYNLLPDQSYWHVRSIFCNKDSCKYYKEP